MNLLMSIIAITFFINTFAASMIILISGGLVSIAAKMLGYFHALDYSSSFAILYSLFVCVFILLSFVNKYQNQIKTLTASEASLLHMNQVLNSTIAVREEKITKALDMNRDILNNVSHEIRTPIQIATGAIELLVEAMNDKVDMNSKPITKLILEVENGVERIKRYAGNMLDLSEYQHGKMLFDIKPGNFVEFMEKCVKPHENILLKIDENLPENIEFDPVKMRRVFEELILNANDYSGKGPIEIHLEQEGKCIKISVKDSGIGIPENELKSIFEPLYIGSRTKSSAGGKGMGLAIVHGAVLGHKGWVRAYNNSEVGSTIEIILPIKQPKSAFLGSNAHLEDDLPAIDLGKIIQDIKTIEKTFGKRKPKILLIEDERSLQATVGNCVASQGYDFVGFMSGAEAVDYIMSDEFDADVVLLDMMLPDTDGLKIMQKTHEKLAKLKIPVIIQSGLAESDGMIQAVLELGAKKFMGKPYSLKELKEELKQCLGLV
jgi:signal transduction histidine kinase/ActR/RegA family two-component response regulator